MLPEEMWAEWLDDEIMCEGAGGDNQSIFALCEKALQDYNYLKVCKRYVRYTLKSFDAKKIDEHKVRSVLESVLRVYALWAKSDKFWRPYLEFELALGDTLKIRSVYRRWSVLPTPSMAEAFLEYSKWEKCESEFDLVASKHKKALL